MSSENLPLSPHLQIYKLPLTAVLSISHRLTGVVISIGAVLLIWFLVALASGPETYATAHNFILAWYGQIILFLFTYALYFHFCNGLRHLIWDLGYGFELETVDKSSVAVLVASIVLTVLTWLVAILV